MVHLVALSDSVVQYEWFTPWTPAVGIDAIKGVLRNLSVTGNFESRLAIQTAEVRTDDPDTPGLLETSYLGQGSRCTTVLDITSFVAGKQWVRFGVAYHLSSGSTPGQADTSLELSWTACGRTVGGGTFQLITPGTTSQFQPVGDWLPATEAEQLMATVVVTAAVGNFRCQLSMRKATTTREVPSAWQSGFEGSWHNGNGEFNTTAQDTSADDQMWVQPGIEHNLSSGSDGGACVTVVIGARRS